MEVCLARAVRLGAVVVGLLTVVVGGLLTLSLVFRAWDQAEWGGSPWGTAFFSVLAVLTPAAAVSGWCSQAGESPFARFAAASALALPVALVVGFVFLVVSTPAI